MDWSINSDYLDGVCVMTATTGWTHRLTWLKTDNTDAFASTTNPFLNLKFVYFLKHVFVQPFVWYFHRSVFLNFISSHYCGLVTWVSALLYQALCWLWLIDWRAEMTLLKTRMAIYYVTMYISHSLFLLTNRLLKKPKRRLTVREWIIHQLLNILLYSSFH